MKLGDVIGLAGLLPEVLRLVGAIKAALGDKDLSEDEVREIGSALVALIKAVVRQFGKVA